MSDRMKIISFINNFLEIDKFEDYCFNGLQIEGKNEIEKVVTGVSLNMELVNRAIEKQADMILVHHGIFGKDFFQIKGIWKNRIKNILANDINLAGYHLPLDAHRDIGNNSMLIKNLEMSVAEKFDLGWIGEYENAVDIDDFIQKVNLLLKTKSYVIKNGVDRIRTVGVISGGASKWVTKAIDKGLDVFLCGDIKEDVVDIVKESKINFINAGHYRTEKLGLQALGDLLRKEFGILVEFVNIDNEI